ncbi:MAG TPA: family 16 glycoside hydrolase [Terracidiphilus sp.]|nr:family 16 glycoside hydrolase [Terracidiphilus sp.]
MLPIVRDSVLFVAAAMAGAGIVTGAVSILRSPTRGLPYHDDFENGRNSEWTAYDGNWTAHSGAMVNESNERGAKLVTGSPYWTDYALDADIALNSTGDAGIIARVSNAEPGVDSYSGIYGGLRDRDESLVLGVANHDWDEIAVKPMPNPILSNVWYHLHMEVRDCHVSLSANQKGMGATVRLDVSLAHCPPRGKIGLRSYDSGGQWKDVQVTKLSSAGH